MLGKLTITKNQTIKNKKSQILNYENNDLLLQFTSVD